MFWISRGAPELSAEAYVSLMLFGATVLVWVAIAQVM